MISSLFLIYFVSFAFAVDWAKLTEEQLRNLPASDFTSISNTELGSIRTVAIPGFQKDQISAIPANSITGFTNSQISAIPSAAVSGFSSQQISKLDGASFTPACKGINQQFLAGLNSTACTGFQKDCITAIPSASYAYFNASQINQIPVAAISGIGRDQMQKVTQAGAAGFTSDQVAAFDTTSFYPGCAGISVAVAAGLVPNACAGFVKDCISVIPASSFASFTYFQIAKLSPSAASGIVRDQMAKITVDGASGFNIPQVAAFDTSSFYPGCSGISQNVADGIQGIACSGFVKACISLIPASTFQSFKSENFGNFTVDAASGIVRDQMNRITASAASGFTSAQVAKFDTSSFYPGCAGISGNVIGGLSPNACSGFIKGCVSLIPASSFVNFTQSRIGNLSVSGSSGIVRDQMAKITVNGASGFTSAQVAAFDTSSFYPGCSGISSSVIAGLPPNACSGFIKACVSLIPALSFANFTSDKIGQLSANGASGIVKDQMAKITTEAASGFTSAQVAAFDTSSFYPGCSGISGAVIKGFTTTAVAGFSAGCIKLIPAVGFSNWNSFQIAKLTTGAVSGIDKSQMVQLTQDAAGGFTADQVAAFDTSSFYPGCSGVSNNIFAGLTDAAYAGFVSNCVSYVPGPSFSSILAARVPSLTEAFLSGVTSQTGFLPTPTILAFADIQLHQLSNRGKARISAVQLLALIQKSDTFISFYSNDEWSQLNQQDASISANLVTFHEFFKNGTLVPKFTTFNDVGSITWLQMIYVKDDSFATLITKDNILSVNNNTFLGIRDDQIVKLPAAAFANIYSMQLQSLLLAPLQALTQQQQAAINPNYFPYLWYLLYIPGNHITWITIPQLNATLYSTNYFGRLPCTSINNLTKAQIEFVMNQNIYSESLNNAFHRCDNTGAPTFPTSAPTPAPTRGPTAPTDTGAPTNETPAIGRWYSILGIVLGCIIVISVIAFLVYKKFSHRQEYEMIQ